LGKALGGIDALQILLELGMVALPDTSAAKRGATSAGAGASPRAATAQGLDALVPGAPGALAVQPAHDSGREGAIPPAALPVPQPARADRVHSPVPLTVSVGAAPLPDPEPPLPVSAPPTAASVPAPAPAPLSPVAPDPSPEPLARPAAPLSPAAVGDGGEVAAPAAPLTLDDYKAQVVAFFEAELGAAADTLVAQIRACSTRRDLKPLLLRGMDNLRYFKGATAAAAFEQGLGRLLPRR
jgi:hypothetical protein